MKFNQIGGTFFWANGSTYDTIKLEKHGEIIKITIDVLGGKPLDMAYFDLNGFGNYSFKKNTKNPGKSGF
jgi:hypothetical protein